MCGRYNFVADESFYSRFEVTNRELELPINFNVAPGMTMPVITKNSPKQVQMMKWGLVPSWAKDPKIGYRMINAKAETVAEKPAFRSAFAKRRCLVPANGFYEWKKDGKKKIPFYFHALKNTYIALAGLYEEWEQPDGMQLLTYTILTTEANPKVSPVHPRMPVILDPDEEEVWLNRDASKEELTALLDPYTQEMSAYEVSERVNSAQANDSKLNQPVKS